MKILGLKGNTEGGFPTVELIGSLWNFKTDENGNIYVNVMRSNHLTVQNFRFLCYWRHRYYEFRLVSC